MKKTALFASALVLGTGVSLASAQTRGTTYQGSDTLEVVVSAVTAACAESPAMSYLGGGSGTGEGQMGLGNQDIAPMSSLMKAANVGVKHACQLNIADDAIGLWRVGTSSCNNIPSAQATLRLIYFGLGSTGDGSTSAQVNGRSAGCDGADAATGVSAGQRAALISNWNGIFGCSGSECASGLRHAFRRDDTSGTTDTFRKQLGVSTSLNPAAPAAGGVPVVPFCNGNDVGRLPTNPSGYAAGRVQQDLDPVRVASLSPEDVSGPIPFTNTGAPFNFPAKTLGVVLTIEVPTAFSSSGSTVAASAADLFNPTPCVSGQFLLVSNPSVAPGVCPDGTSPVGPNLCYAPSAGTPTNPVFNCTANPARPGNSPSNFDGRIYNTVLRDAAGNIRVQPPAGTLSASSTRRINTAFYRLHTLGRTVPSVVPACNSFLDATHTIGCFTKADPCTIGYAGFDADTVGGIKPVTINGVQPLVSAGVPNSSYLFYRKLWINALNCTDAGGNAISAPYNGVTNILQNDTNAGSAAGLTPADSRYQTLFQCFRDQGTAKAVAAGFFAPVGSSASPVVQPFGYVAP
ncbi:MAG: hypothetical protein JWN04_2046 [Myxococcaceae bacterium]|nr:hypothetical protein [Myxococcaceae bacterium]